MKQKLYKYGSLLGCVLVGLLIFIIAQGQASNSGDVTVNVPSGFTGNGSVNITIVGQDQGGNTLSAPINLNLTTSPVVTCSPNPKAAEAGVIFTLSASGGDGNYSWSGGDWPPSGTGTGPNYSIYFNNVGTYTVNVTSAGQTDPCTVNVTNPGELTCSPEYTTTTIGGSVNFAASGGGVGTYSWISPGGATPATGGDVSNFTATFYSPGLQQVIVKKTDENDVVKQDSCDVFVGAVPPEQVGYHNYTWLQPTQTGGVAPYNGSFTFTYSDRYMDVVNNLPARPNDANFYWWWNCGAFTPAAGTAYTLAQVQTACGAAPDQSVAVQNEQFQNPPSNVSGAVLADGYKITATHTYQNSAAYHPVFLIVPVAGQACPSGNCFWSPGNAQKGDIYVGMVRNYEVRSYWEIPNDNALYQTAWDYNSNGSLEYNDSVLLNSVVQGSACPGGKTCDFNSDGPVNSQDVTDFRSYLQKQIPIPYDPARVSGQIYLWAVITSATGAVLNSVSSYPIPPPANWLAWQGANYTGAAIIIAPGATVIKNRFWSVPLAGALLDGGYFTGNPSCTDANGNPYGYYDEFDVFQLYSCSIVPLPEGFYTDITSVYRQTPQAISPASYDQDAPGIHKNDTLSLCIGSSCPPDNFIIASAEADCNATTSQISLAWQDSTNATGYDVYRKMTRMTIATGIDYTDPGFTKITATPLPGSANSYNDPNIIQYKYSDGFTTNYRFVYKVQAINASGNVDSNIFQDAKAGWCSGDVAVQVKLDGQAWNGTPAQFSMMGPIALPPGSSPEQDCTGYAYMDPDTGEWTGYWQFANGEFVYDTDPVMTSHFEPACRNVPQTYLNLMGGTWTLSNVSGGPVGASLAGITNAGGTAGTTQSISTPLVDGPKPNLVYNINYTTGPADTFSFTSGPWIIPNTSPRYRADYDYNDDNGLDKADEDQLATWIANATPCPGGKTCLASASAYATYRATLDIYRNQSDGVGIVSMTSTANATITLTSTGPAGSTFTPTSVNIPAGGSGSSIFTVPRSTLVGSYSIIITGTTAQGLSQDSSPYSLNVLPGSDFPIDPTDPEGGNWSTSGGIIPCGQVKFTWTDNSSNETGFYMYKLNNPGTPMPPDRIATLGAGVSTYTYTPPDNNAYYYFISAYNDSGESNKVAINNNPFASTPCGANLSSSDKDIVALNGADIGSGLGNQCGSTDALSGGTVLKLNDKLKFSINLCNSGPGEASNIKVIDSMLNLKQPPGGWNAKYDDGGGEDALGSGGASAITLTVSGSEPNQTLTFENIPNLPGTAGLPTIRRITFEALLAIPLSFTGQSARFQNSFKIEFDDGDGMTFKNSFTPLLPFYTGDEEARIIEVP